MNIAISWSEFTNIWPIWICEKDSQPLTPPPIWFPSLLAVMLIYGSYSHVRKTNSRIVTDLPLPRDTNVLSKICGYEDSLFWWKWASTAYFFCFSFFLGNKTAWMLGRTPPDAIVTPERSLFNSSSFRTASWRWRGMILAFLLSRAAFPANSKISADKYSRTAAK